jgi:hypothetical protein
MINMIFDACVRLLVFLAERIGITYQAINVWIFVILWPIFTLALVAVVLVQRREIHRLRQQLARRQSS